MEVPEYLRALRSRWRWLVGSVLLGLLVAGAVTATTTPLYEARTQLFVSTRQSADGMELFSGSSFSQQRVKSYTKVVTTPRVLDPVIQRLGLDETTADLANSITVEAPLDTVLVDIAVRDPDPERAADIANAVGMSFTSVVDTLERMGNEPSPVRISPVREAMPPTAPVLPSPVLNLALGLLLGLVVGGVAALLRNMLDTAVRREKDLTALVDVPVLGEIPFDRQAGVDPILLREPHSPHAEAFRALRTNLQFVDVVSKLDSLIVTSSMPNEGKSTIAVNLALACVDNGLTVCIVDADLRRPSVAQYLGLVDVVGLTTVLLGRVSLDEAIQRRGEDGLYVLAAGDTPPNPSELLGTQAMSNVLDELRKQFDLVIVDSPPLLPVTDGALLSTRVAGVLLVTGLGRVRRDQVRRSLRNLETGGARLLGVVLNLVPMRVHTTGTYYHYYHRQVRGRAPRVRWRRLFTRQAPANQPSRVAVLNGHRPAAGDTPYKQAIQERPKR